MSDQEIGRGLVREPLLPSHLLCVMYSSVLDLTCQDALGFHEWIAQLERNATMNTIFFFFFIEIITIVKGN